MSTAAPSLYRRHRPRTFADVVGQEHVVRTLRNAVSSGRVHHAYLFVGSRGTGKTSMAKILAASLNCQGESGGGHGPGGPTPDPCGECESCLSIATATSLDVVEMDAASNNSVDDIRDLRERVAYAPVAGRHKVYILDEAHMLTTAAWNAFLKTLEEPPPHTVFVLATTEANKVLPTVVDRCHRFDFARPGVAQIAQVLRRAADAESIAIPDEAVALVARSATGSFRDALGTLEQLLAYAGPSIALDDVLAVLGAADADLLFGSVDAVSSGDARTALLAAARLADSGRDVGRFFGDLEAHARSLMVVQVLGEVPDELAVTPEQDERLAEQASRVGMAEVVRLLELIAASLRAMKDGADARTQLELALVKAAKPSLEPSVKALQARLERLEARPVAPPPLPPARPSHDLVPETAAGRAATPAARPAPTHGAPPSAPGGPAPTRPASGGSASAPPASGGAASVRPASGGASAGAGSAPPIVGGPSVGGAPMRPASGSAPAGAGSAPPIVGGPPVGGAAVAPASGSGPAGAAPTSPSSPAGAPPGPAAGAPVQPEPAPRYEAAPAWLESVPFSPGDEYEEMQAARSAPPRPAPTNVPPARPEPVAPRQSAPEAPRQAAPVAQHQYESVPSRQPDPVAPRQSETAAPRQHAPTPAVAAEPEPTPPAASGVSIGSLAEFAEVWPAVVDALRADSPMLAALLEDAHPAKLVDGGLTLAWSEASAFLKRKAEDPANRDRIANAIRSVTGSSLRLNYEIRGDHEPVPVTAATLPVLSEDDLVQRFKDEFDAEELPPEPEET